MVILLLDFAPAIEAQPLQLVSAPDPAAKGPPAGGGGDSWSPIITPDGRFVLFASAANNLVQTTKGPIPLRIPPRLNVYLRDRLDRTTTLVSVNLSGVGGNGDSLPVDLSTNGRYAVFESSASDLVSGDTNTTTDVFVRDLVSGTMVLVSVNTNGVAGNGASHSASMTPDGRYVAFSSAATDLVPDDTNGIPDIFVRDLQVSRTALASPGAVLSSSPYRLSGSQAPLLSDDGRYVVFYSAATGLVAAAQSGGEIYVRDLVENTTIWASSYSRTALGTSQAVSFNHALSADGKFVAYEAQADDQTNGVILRYNLDTGTTDLVHDNAAVARAQYEDIQTLNMTPDGRFIAFLANTNRSAGNYSTCVQLWHAQTGALTLVSGDPDGLVPTNSVCDWPVVDPSGRFVAFMSTATGLVTNALVGEYHLYLRDTQTAQTILLDADPDGVGSPVSAGSIPQLSADARFAAFECADATLVPNDWNHGADVFLRNIAAGSTELISAHDPSQPSTTAGGPSTLGVNSVSADGRYVAFSSEADNLVADDTNGLSDVFVRDLATGNTVMVSRGTNGMSADNASFQPAISPDGRYVAFASAADNLVPADSNRYQDVFLCDLQSGALTLVSVNTNGTGPGDNLSDSPLIGTDGRYVAFRSKARNLARIITTGFDGNVFVRDRENGTTYALTSTGVGIFTATPNASRIAVSPDPYYSRGTWVWDAQLARNVYSNAASSTGLALTRDGSGLATGMYTNLYVTDLATGTSRLIDSLSSAWNSFEELRFSADSQWLVAIQSSRFSTNHVWVYHLPTGTRTLVDHQYGSTDAASGGPSDSPAISPDGRFIAYRGWATNIVVGDINGLPDVFLYDRLTGQNALLGAGLQNGVTYSSLRPVFSADGCTLLFESWAADLATGDFNLSSDLFAHTLLYSFIRPGGPGQGPWLSWPWVPGAGYRVQYKDAFADTEWHDLSAAITNSGNKAWLQDPSPAAGQRVYRVISF